MRRRIIVTSLFGMLSSGVFAVESSLPEPLTLEQALEFVDEPHPDILYSQAKLAKAQAGLEHAKSGDDANVYLEARAQWVSPPAVLEAQGRDDHRAQLVASKPLYDFGRTGNRVDAAYASVAAQQFYLKQQQMQRRYDIMHAYFNVVLSDIRYARDNEDMATGFVRYDRVRDRQELGQYSDIDVLEAESEYQQIRRQRYESESRQRQTRSRLALVLNRPDQIPSRVVPPNIKSEGQQLPELAEMQKWLGDNNLELMALREELKSVREQIEGVGAEYWPKLDAQVLLGAYSRDLGSNDNWRAGVTLNVPLYQGNYVSARKAELIAERQRLESQIVRRERDLKQRLLELSIRFSDLKIKLEEMNVKKDYRELYLDRARSLYEMEVKTDLGDAMVELTQANLDWTSASFERALVYEEMNILTAGRLREQNQ